MITLKIVKFVLNIHFLPPAFGSFFSFLSSFFSFFSFAGYLSFLAVFPFPLSFASKTGVYIGCMN